MRNTGFTSHFNPAAIFKPLALLIIVLVAIQSYEPPLVNAQEDSSTAAAGLPLAYPVERLEQRDANSDGRPEQTLITTSFAGEQDLILVYDGGNDMVRSSDWRTATDFTNDTWLFDVNANGDYQLVIQFSVEADETVARVFMDQDGDGRVLMNLRDGVQIRESQYPAVTIRVRGDWTLPDGGLNWNVSFFTDGYPFARIGDSVPESFFTQWIPFMQQDGIPDTEYRFGDENQDGVAEYGIWLLLADTPDSMHATRTWIDGDKLSERIPLHENAVFFPYLIPAERLDYGDALPGLSRNGLRPTARGLYEPPYIAVDWRDARVSAPTFKGFELEDGYHANILRYFTEDEVNYANFEISQAYYDLAGDEDTWPELHIRHRYNAALDPSNGRLPIPVDEIRWSWNQDNAPQLDWDYKLGLAGRQSVDMEQQVGPFRYLTIPYDNLRDWVLDQPWDYATFVAAEGIGQHSNEGIYSWPPVEMADTVGQASLSDYLAGNGNFDLRAIFSSVLERTTSGLGNLTVGMRGELAPFLDDLPMLYFSPIDKRLHLRGAAYCVQDLSESVRVRCDNRIQDPYLDLWQVFQDGDLLKTLADMSGSLLYADNERNTITIRQVTVEPSLFETMPPRNPQEWAALGARLQPYATSAEDVVPAVHPDDLATMFAQFTGPETVIQGAQLRDFRYLTANPTDGFHFSMRVEAGFGITVPAGLDSPDVTGILPGEYSVSYQAGQFTFSPATPANIQVNLHRSDAETKALLPAPLIIDVKNQGSQDLLNLHIVVAMVYEDVNRIPTTILTDQSIDVLGDSIRTLELPWSPAASGNWQAYILGQLGESPLTSTRDPYLRIIEDIRVAPGGASIPARELLNLDGQLPIGGVTVIVFWLALPISAFTLVILLIIFSVRRVRK